RLVAPDVEQPAEELVKRAVRADPVAEGPPQEQRRDEDEDPPPEPPVDRVRGERRGEPDERIHLQEQRRRVAAQPREPRDPEQEEEEAEEEDLRHDPDRGDPHRARVPGRTVLVWFRLETGL